VVEQGAQGDAAAVVARAAHQAGQLAVDGVGQGQPVFGGELQDGRRDERFGDVPGTEMFGTVNSVSGARET
jgi:hypothetical protein